MNWWLIFGGIVLFGLIQTGVLVWWLWRQGRALVAELGSLAERADELARILSDLHTVDHPRGQSN